jgi:microcystin-dependent protein
MTTISKKLFISLIGVIAAISFMMPLNESAEACGEYPFIGEICLFAFNFCPVGYHEADGSLMQINQNQALFSVLGTTYGGDGLTTFALPDLRGRTPVNAGQGSELSNISLGEQGGAEQVTLTVSQMPSHSHNASTTVDVTATLQGSTGAVNSTDPGGNVLGTTRKKAEIYTSGAADVAMGTSAIVTQSNASTTVSNAGGGQPIDVRSPFLGMKYCIAVQGIFPAQQ